MVVGNTSKKSESAKANDASIAAPDQCMMGEDGKAADHIEVVSVDVVNLDNDNDNSIASADDQVPDIQHAPLQDLNYLA